MMEDHGLSGRFALVTGSSRGIGRAIARALAQAGCNVAIASRSASDARAVAREIRQETQVAVLGAECDVSSPASVRDLFGVLRGWSSGQLEVLVCNAGYPFDTEIWNTPLQSTAMDQLEDWCLRIFRTDTLGSVFCTREALPLMIAQRRGSIIYISSIPALQGFKGIPYTVAKAAILGLMKDVALEHGKYGIRANALALGNIRTPATFDRLDPETQAAFASESPLGRWGDPQEVAQAALFLASSRSSFISGQTLVVDGGIVRR